MHATLATRSDRPHRTSPRGSRGRRSPARTRRHGGPAERTSLDRHDPCRRQPARRHAAATIAAHPTPRVAVARSRRRAVAGVLLAIVVACGLVLAHDVLSDPSGVPASAASGRPASLGSVVTARPGDSLWSIAERHHGAVPIARYVDELVDLNGGPGIQAGQAVLLP